MDGKKNQSPSTSPINGDDQATLYPNRGRGYYYNRRRRPRTRGRGRDYIRGSYNIGHRRKYNHEETRRRSDNDIRSEDESHAYRNGHASDGDQRYHHGVKPTKKPILSLHPCMSNGEDEDGKYSVKVPDMDNTFVNTFL